MKNRLFRFMCIALCASLVAASAAEAAGPAQETPEQRDARMRWWREARFGMFIHWGPVSLWGTEISWTRGKGAKAEEYDKLYEKFNPVEFNAEEWVSIAKAAGMKYMVFTSRHHDGFSMFDTKASDYKITNPKSPYRRDVVKELADACHKAKMPLGIYYSQPDWRYPKDAPLKHGDYVREQLRELLTNYGRVDLIWFDGLGGRVDPENLHAMMRGLQPHLLINNRNGLAEDFDTPEQKIGGFNRQRPWETCMTICRQWSWKPDDTMKDLKECLQTLIRTVGGDGNLLFNVGPMPDGRIEPRQVERLKEMGKWLEKYGDGIYGTRGGPCLPGNWGASTCKGNTVYLFVMQWPEHGKLALPSVTQKVRKCTVLSGGEATWTQSADAVEIAVPKKDRDEIATVIALEVAGNAFDMEPSRISQRSNSLAYRKKATATNIYRNQATFGPGMAVDDDPETRWATDSGTRNAQLEVDLGKPAKIGSVFIDERQWNRIRKFQLQYKDGEEWKTLLEGSTVGDAFSKTFSPSTAQHVRLNILEATDAPTIWEFQLFEAQEK